MRYHKRRLGGNYIFTEEILLEDENNISFTVDIPGDAPEEKKEETPEEKAARKRKKFKAELLDWAKTLFFFCVIPVLIFECFCFVARVPTGSMETTVPAGAEVFTTRCFNKDNIKRGDVVVFYNDELDPTLFKQYIGLRGDIAAFFNDELELILFKRCIGLPGDTVEFDGTGDVYINGELYEEPYVSSFSDFEGTFTVPEDCYFFCGDNRGGSWDARYWDNPYINKENVKGKARFIFFPFNSIGAVK